MQNYLWRKLESSLYTGKSGKVMRTNPHSFNVAGYLICCQQSTDIGIFRFEPDIECVRMGLTPEECRAGLQTCIESGFCQFDPEAELVYIPNYTKIQIGELKERDNRRQGIHKTIKAMPDHPFNAAWVEKYKDIYGRPETTKQDQREAPLKPLQSPSRAPSKGVASPSEAPQKPLQQAKKEEPEQEATYPGEHVMGQLTEEQKAAGYEAQRIFSEEQAAKRAERMAKSLGSNEAKQNQAPSKPLQSPSEDPYEELSRSLEAPSKPLGSPFEAPREPLTSPSEGATARKETETETETERNSPKENSDLILQTGNQPGGDLLAGAPVLPLESLGEPDMAKVIAHLERLGVPGNLEEGSRWLVASMKKTPGTVAIVLSAITDVFDPFSLEAKAVRSEIEPWKVWLMMLIPEGVR